MSNELLTKVCGIQYGFPFDSKQFSKENGMPLIRIRDIQRGYSDTYTTEPYKEEYLIYEGDLLIGMDGEFNIARWGKIPSLLNQRVCRLKPNEAHCNKDYIFYCMPQILKKIEDKTSFVTVKHLSAKQLNAIEIPLPSLAEQQKIADTLDKVSHLIALRKGQLEKLDLLVKAKFVEMFGDPIINDKNWDIRILGDISSSRLGKMLDSKKQMGIKKHPYLGNTNVQWFKFQLDELKEMEFNSSECVEFSLQKDDLLVCEGGEVGRCAIWNNELANCYFQKAIHRIRCDKNIILPQYLGYTFYCHSQYNGFSDVISGVSTIAHLPGERLKKLEIITPPLALQTQFADYVTQVETSKQQIQQGLEKLETLYRGLMQEYFE